MRGPSPAALGIDAGRIVRVNEQNAAVARARAFARPSTAIVLGARGPVPHVVRTRGVPGRGVPVPRTAPVVVPRAVVPRPAGGGGGRGRR
jgi:hypothetical protein